MWYTVITKTTVMQVLVTTNIQIQKHSTDVYCKRHNTKLSYCSPTCTSINGILQTIKYAHTLINGIRIKQNKISRQTQNKQRGCWRRHGNLRGSKNSQKLNNNRSSRFGVWTLERCFFKRWSWNSTGCLVRTGHHRRVADRRNARIIKTVWIRWRWYSNVLHGRRCYDVAYAGTGRVLADHEWTARDQFSETLFMWESVAGAANWALAAPLRRRSSQHALKSPFLWLHFPLPQSHLITIMCPLLQHKMNCPRGS